MHVATHTSLHDVPDVRSRAIPRQREVDPAACPLHEHSVPED